MQYFSLIILYLSFNFFSQIIEAVDFSDCGSHFSIQTIEVEGCDKTDTLCIIELGSVVNVTFSLNTGKFDIDASLINDVTFVVSSVKYNLTVTPQDPCEVLLCPLEVDYAANFTGLLNVTLPAAVSIAGKIQWVVRITEFWEQVLCFEFPTAVLAT